METTTVAGNAGNTNVRAIRSRRLARLAVSRQGIIVLTKLTGGKTSRKWARVGLFV